MVMIVDTRPSIICDVIISDGDGNYTLTESVFSHEYPIHLTIGKFNCMCFVFSSFKAFKGPYIYVYDRMCMLLPLTAIKYAIFWGNKGNMVALT